MSLWNSVAAGVLCLAWAAIVDWWWAAAWLDPVGSVLALGPAVILALFKVAAMMSGLKPSLEAKTVSLVSLFLAVLLVVSPWNARKCFLSNLFLVRIGMTVDEVESIMRGYIKGAGPAWQLPREADPRIPSPGEAEEAAYADAAKWRFRTYSEPRYGGDEEKNLFTGAMIYRWSTDAGHNSDWGYINFVVGKVTSVKFWKD